MTKNQILSSKKEKKNQKKKNILYVYIKDIYNDHMRIRTYLIIDKN